MSKYPRGEFKRRVAEELGHPVEDVWPEPIGKDEDGMDIFPKPQYVPSRIDLVRAKLKVAEVMFKDDPDKQYKIRDYTRILNKLQDE